MRVPGRLLCLVVLPLVSVAALAVGRQEGPPPVHRPLRAFLAEAGVAADGLPAEALDATAMDFAAERGAASVVIAYRTAVPGEGSVLHVRSIEHGTLAWRSATFDTPEATRGSVTQVRHTGPTLLVDLEREGRLGDVLVLDRAMTLRSRVEGSLVEVLPDGSLVYRENLEPQRPAQPLAVSIFVPGTGRHARIYPPAPPASSVRERFTERVRRAFTGWGLSKCLAAGHPCNAEAFDAFIVSELRSDARGHRFGWITRFGPAEGERDGPVGFHVHVVVSCDRPEGAVGARCREQPFGQYDGPDGPNTQGALAMTLVRRGERR